MIGITHDKSDEAQLERLRQGFRLLNRTLRNINGARSSMHRDPQLAQSYLKSADWCAEEVKKRISMVADETK